jgi:hypothetical protein
MKGKPIQIQPDANLRKKIEDEAKAQDRKLGPQVLYILRQFFDRKESAK